MTFYEQSLGVPPDIADKAMALKIWMEKFGATSVYGMGDVVSAHRQLDECKALLAEGRDLVRDQSAENAQLRAELARARCALTFADALINKGRT